ncbi:hypothetical protein JW960_14695 [candidate division KSB1 bacterium]|nr:hypothetical protein [candidate division KSB1 bacterium]
MKSVHVRYFILCLMMSFLACSGTDTIFKTVEKTKLAPPLGLHSVTQNGQIKLMWYTSNYEDDFGGYFVFQADGDLTSQSSDSALGTAFVKVDSVTFNLKDDNNVLVSDEVVSYTRSGLTNGTTYSFAIATFNRKDKKKISYPSNIIKDTPRPDIQTIVLKSASTNQVTGDDLQAGFDFDTFTVKDVPASGYTNTNGVDIINEAFDPSSGGNIRAWLAGMNGGGLQDLGYMNDLDGSDIAPEAGYSEQGKSIAALIGHVYAVKTGENKYGKLIITNISSSDYSIEFNAAFQLQEGNRNYKLVPDDYALGIHK